MEKRNLRQEYLRALGLKTDPFISPVAEQELNQVGILEKFLEYFTFPLLEVGGQAEKLDFQNLRANRHTIVFGQPGAGKTTLRMALEADYRKTIRHALVVTLELSESQEAEPGSKDPFEQLAVALSRDLFVQVCEQFNPLSEFPSSEQIEALRRQITLAKLGRVIEKMLDDPTSSMPFGIASHWSLVGKKAIRYIPPAKELLDLLRAVKPITQQQLLASGKTALEQSLEASRLWGFTQVAVLVDTVDQFNPEPEFMLGLIRPLLQEVDFWHTHQMSLKLFLTLDFERRLMQFLKETRLQKDFDYARIVWDGESLAQLIQHRFEAAGSRHTSLGALASEDAARWLEDYLLSEAASPREVLERINFFFRKIARRKRPASADFELEDIQLVEQARKRK